MPSTVVDYTLSNTPPVAVDLTPALSNTAPVAVDLAPALTGADAASITVGAALTSTPPESINAGVSLTDTVAVPHALQDFTPQPTPALPIMPANFSPGFVELTGAGPSLSTLSASAADLNRIVQGTVGGELKSYQVRAGTDVQALPGIVRPANYDGTTNAYVFVSV